MPEETNIPSENQSKPQEMDLVSIDYLMGKFDPTTHEAFSKIPKKYASKSNLYLRTETVEALIQMIDSAKNDGHILTVISATRPFHHQKSIWERKWNGVTKVGGQALNISLPDEAERALKILEYSSMPGTSRHHWGTDFDLNNLNNSYFEKGKGLAIYNWLVEHASKFGFAQAYTPKGAARPFGYEEEKWHWSYVPRAVQFTRQYVRQIANDSIDGFDGSNAAKEIDIVQKYVNGVAASCR